MRQRAGFSFVELLMVITISGIISSIVGLSIANTIKSYFLANNISSLNAQANNALTMMSSEIKGAISFSTISSTTISFQMANGTPVKYALSGNTILRYQNGSSSGVTLADSVSSLGFNYYDKNLALTSNTSNLAAVLIQLSLQNSSNTLSLINAVYLGNAL